jgi:L-ascorbate metabolism protein UlaG (beta-lactamase superfamily)
MRDYTIVFIEPVELNALAQAVSEAFAVPRDQIEVWNGRNFTAPVTEPAIAQIAVGSGPGAFAEFVAFDAFAEHTGSPDHLSVAVELATRMKKRVVFGPESAEEFRWTLVAADGTHGNVVVDSEQLDDGAIAILGAVEPIEGAPDLPLIDSGTA